jgi:hypothetical protein
MADSFDSRNSYVASPSPIDPTGIQYPNPWQTNALGSNYATEFSYDETDLLKKEIARQIFDAAPAKYKVFPLLFEKTVEYVGDDEFSYMEKTFGRTALKVADNPGVATGATQVITLTTGGTANITANKLVVYPNNRKGIVTLVDIANEQITVQRLNGQANLPALTLDDYLSIQGSVIADGLNALYHYDRMSKITRYNYVQLMHRDKRWTRKEMTKFRNNGTSNYFELDKKEQMDLLLQDMFSSFWNGERGEVDFTIPGNATGVFKAKLMGGIFPLMVAAGCATAAGVTDATLQATFERLAFETNYQSEGGVRFIFAQNALLYELSKVYKETGIRYAPNDKIADLNLTEYKIGDMRFVPVATELFKELSMFPVTWKHRIFILDLDTITPVCMRGYEPIEVGQTAPKGESGSLNDYMEWWIQGMLSLKFNNPLGSFYIDTTGIVS